MTWGAGEGWTLPARHGGSGYRQQHGMTVLLLGEVADIPGCRLDGEVGGAVQRKLAVMREERWPGQPRELLRGG